MLTKAGSLGGAAGLSPDPRDTVTAGGTAAIAALNTPTRAGGVSKLPTVAGTAAQRTLSMAADISPRRDNDVVELKNQNLKK